MEFYFLHSGNTWTSDLIMLTQFMKRTILTLLFAFLLFQSFSQVSNAVLWTKASYYPLKKIVRGFNIQLGPSVGYSYRSKEAAGNVTIDASGNATRQSYLSFDNGFTVGYRISTGIEFDITK